jgi:hypothetical protein
VEAPRKHGSFGGRWPCIGRDSATERAEELNFPEPGRAQLSLVPIEPASDPATPHLEDAGTARLMAAMAAARSANDRTRRNPWL